MLRIILGIVFCLVCVILMLVILLQRGRGTGLSGAFGGAGGQSAFGAKTGDYFTWATVAITAVFLFLAVALNWTWVPEKFRGTEQSVITTDNGSAAPSPTTNPADE